MERGVKKQTNYFRRRRPLPPHPNDEQFSKSLDLARRDWADRFYLIASTPRCGSHYLSRMLLEAGEYGVPMEYLNPYNREYWIHRFGTDDLASLFPKFVERRTSENGNFCFTAHWRQFEPFSDRVDELTRGKGIEKVVWIVRRNLMRQAISFEIARQTGAWNSTAPEMQTPLYDYAMLVAAARMIRDSNLEWKRLLERDFSGKFNLLIYEEFINADERQLDALRQFLGGNNKLKPSARLKVQRGTRNTEWEERFVRELKEDHRWILENASPL